ncbi:MAG: glycosyltransferase [Halioglobus sp.]
MNIQWLSPLDPEKTEIGRYSQTVLPLLKDFLSLGVVTDSIDKYEKLACEKHVMGMAPINIYNLGNSYLHCGILRQAMLEPGIIILHDVNLLELGLAYARENSGFSLRSMIVEEHGFYAGKAFDEIYCGSGYEWCGQSQSQYDEFVNAYPLFKTFIKNAFGVIVHSDYALSNLRKVYGGPVIKLDLPYTVTTNDVSERHQNTPCEIVFCGHAGPNRRLRQFIEAWSEVSRPDYFRLSLYGNIDKAEELLSLAEQLGLNGLINVVGFVEEDVLEDAISSSHLALNLRNPTMGEASASQLRYWSSAIPSMVSDVGWYSELPHNVVIKVSPHNEKQDIISVLENFILGNQAYFDSGINGFRYLCNEHGAQQYVERLTQFVEEIAWNRFVGSIFDNRLINVMESMCEDIEDADIFDDTLLKVSEMISGLEQDQSENINLGK